MSYALQLRQVNLSSKLFLLSINVIFAINVFGQSDKLFHDLPVGQYGVGFQIISITDSTRISKAERNYLGEKNEGNRYRRFTIHLWYPAVAEPGKSKLSVGDYTYNNKLQTIKDTLSDKEKNISIESIRASLERWFGKPDDNAWRSFLQTSMLAIPDAKPVPQKFPLLIGMLRPFSTSLTNEVLASNGYVVAMVSSPSNSSFSNSALGQIPDMQLAMRQLGTHFDGSRIGVFGFSGSGFIPVLFGMFDLHVKALADLESGIYMDGLYEALAESNYYQPAQLRIPFLHIFSRDLSKQEKYLDELERKTQYSKRYRLLLNQPSLHHWDFATEGYASATVLNLRGQQAANIKNSFEIATMYLLQFFNAELKEMKESRSFMSAKPKLTGTQDSLWSIVTLSPVRPAPLTEEFDYIIRKKGIDEALAIVKETLPNDSTTNLREGFALNNLGYVFLREKKLAEAIGIFLLNTELHPDDANFFDSLSEGYEAAGNTEEMKQTAQKVLGLLVKKPSLNDAEKALKQQALKRSGS
jgi:tetratricopeptide (TPR) repeat protein